MINKLKPKSEFSKNVLTLMTGTTIAQAIPIAISPILTRIYSPEDFGILALFMAIVMIFGSISNGRYELAIMLPKKDQDAINIFALGLIITLSISILLLIIVILFNQEIVSILKNQEIKMWLYFIPFVVFFIGLYNLLNYFNNRKKNYKDLKNTIILKSIILAMIQITIGIFKSGAVGLITGQILSHSISNIQLLIKTIKKEKLISKINKKRVLALSKKYINFPKYSLWAVLANTLNLHLINILISTLYSLSTLGFYSLVQRVLGMPSSLIGASITQVFFQESSKLEKSNISIKNLFFKTLKKVMLISIPIFFLLFLFIEDLYAFMFGEKWRIAGEYAEIVILMFLIKFIVAPFTFIPIVYNSTKIDLLFQIGLITISMIVIGISYITDIDFLSFLIYYTFFSSLYYIAYLIYIYLKFIKGK